MSNSKIKPKEDWEKDLEQLLIEWEGGTHPLLGAVRVASRTKTLKSFISQLLQKKMERVVGEIKGNVGNLRQWINEKPQDHLVTNKDIETWLELDELLQEGKVNENRNL